MSILDWAYTSLLLSSTFGALLFLRYTFRIRVQYPLYLVNSHLLTVFLTLILYTIVFIKEFVHHPTWNFHNAFMTVSYIVFILTLGTGLAFYIRYDLRKRILGLQLVSTHLVMAGLTFIFLTAFMVLSIHGPAGNQDVLVGSASPSWFSFSRHQIIRHEGKQSR